MKILIISDIHIDEYPRFNEYKDQRLNQPLLLAQRLDSLSKEHNIEYLYILGDILNKGITTPKVIHVMNEFFSLLSKSFKEVRYILGQHDLGHKNNNIQIEDSFVTLADQTYKNFIYSHNSYHERGGRSIYMSNWDKNIIYPEHKVDVWLSHVTMGFGNEVKEDNYTIGIHGDIHEPNLFGTKNYSVSTPYQLYSHQPEQGFVGLLDLDTLEYQRIYSDSESIKFLRLPKYQKLRINDNTFSSDSEVTETFSLSKILKEIDEEVEKVGLSHIHSSLDKSEVPLPIDFNFQLISLEVCNFRSISHLKLEFDSLGRIIRLDGSNGSGKSSIIKAILTGFLGDKLLKDSVRKGTKDLMIKLVLSYQGIEYELVRYSSKVDFFINGDQENRENKTSTESYIYTVLPFIPYLKFFYIKPNSHYLEIVDKIELFKICFNLDIFDYYKEKGRLLLQEELEKGKKISENLSLYRGRYTQLIEDLDRVSQQINSLTVYDTTIEEVEKRLSNYQKRELQNQINITSKESLTNKLNYLTSSLKELSPDFTHLKDDEIQPIYESLLSLDNLERSVIKSEENITRLEEYKAILIKNEEYILGEVCDHCGERNKEINPKIVETESRIKFCKEDLEILQSKVKASYKSIPSYFDTSKKNDFFIFKSTKEKNIKSELEISHVREEIEKLIFLTEDEILEIKDKIEFYSKIRDDLRSYEYLNSNKLSLLDSINSTRSFIDNLSLNQEDQSKRVKDLEYYQNLFSLEVINSIPYKILDKVSKYLNTESIQFSTLSYLKNGRAKFDINCKILVNEDWIPYQESSDGQKCFLDLIILTRITELVGGVGLILIDEGLSNLDSNMYYFVSDQLVHINCNKMLISSHNNNFVGNDTTISLDLIAGVTNYEII